LFRDENAWHGQDRGTRLADPRVAEPLRGRRKRLLSPILRQTARRQGFDQFIGKAEKKTDKPVWRARIPMRQLFQSSEGFVLAGVDDRDARRVPASAEEPRALAYEGVRGALFRHDAPARVHHE